MHKGKKKRKKLKAMKRKLKGSQPNMSMYHSYGEEVRSPFVRVADDKDSPVYHNVTAVSAI